MEKTAGRFNMEWVSFRNDQIGIEAVRWWSKKVIDWCFNRYENGKMGDQLYLNDWPNRFKNVCIIQHKGAGLAPWNINKFKIHSKTDKVFVNEQVLIFYHFHGFRLTSPNTFIKAPGYFISKSGRILIYEPYMRQLQENIELIRKYDSSFNYGFSKVSFKTIILDRVMNYKILARLIDYLIILKNILIKK